MPVGEPTVSLADHLAWLESIGQVPGCTCRFQWKSGRTPYLWEGWVRMNTARDCPAHRERRGR